LLAKLLALAVGGRANRGSINGIISSATTTMRRVGTPKVPATNPINPATVYFFRLVPATKSKLSPDWKLNSHNFQRNFAF
jgi:hypothetical protein